MNWENFLIGNGCFALAYSLRLFSKWIIKLDWNPQGGNIINWIWVISLTIAGLVYIISSLPNKI
jgi:hypothetical protein